MRSCYYIQAFVYENEYTPGEYYACNDDNANCPGPWYRSWIEQMPVTMGNVYYIVVDGYGGESGDYLFSMYEVWGPPSRDPHDCPPGAFLELEPYCHDGFVDTTNIGCNGSPPIFQYPLFPTHVCGTSGNYDDNTYRDMDWFEFTFPHVVDLEVKVCADFRARVWILDGNGGRGGAFTVVTDAGPPRIRDAHRGDGDAGHLLRHLLDRRLAGRSLRLAVLGADPRGTRLPDPSRRAGA